MQRAIGTLHEHFGNSRSATKIAINLKRCMGIKKVVIGSASTRVSAYRRKLILNKFVGMVSIQHPGPPVYFPAHAPPGRYIAPLYQGVFRGTVQLRSSIRRDLIGRK